MKGFKLNSDQLQELRLAHRLEKTRSAAYKINAVILLGTGWKLKDVRKALLLDDETLRNYVNRYRKDGVKELLATKYAGSKPNLSEAQIRLLSGELERTIHLDTKSVINFCKNEFNVEYSQSGMRDLLHRLGYEYKKPTLVPGNPDQEAQELFTEQYEEFMQKKADDVEVLFLDAVHPEHNAMAAYGWIKKGEKRIVVAND